MRGEEGRHSLINLKSGGVVALVLQRSVNLRPRRQAADGFDSHGMASPAIPNISLQYAGNDCIIGYRKPEVYILRCEARPQPAPP